jgi:hypothetical protein
MWKVSVLLMTYPFWFSPMVSCLGNDYGHPAGGDTEPDVVAQFTFEESSGSVRDSVGGIEVPPVGSPTYGSTLEGIYTCISPGAGGNFNGGTNSYFYLEDSGTEFPSLGFGTSDFTVEVWFSSVSSSTFYPFWFKGLSFPNFDGYNLAITQSTNRISLGIDFGSTSYTFKWVLPDGVTDGEPHKVRITGDRTTGEMVCELDGEVLAEDGAQPDLTDLDGETLTVRDRVRIGGGPDLPFGPPQDYSSILYELRVSRNKTNDSGYYVEEEQGGAPGGGGDKGKVVIQD